jgi:hypothetical protein
MFSFCSSFKPLCAILPPMSSPPLHAPARTWPIPAMDHEAGRKETAFTWAMGHLILQRMGDRETMKAITADPAMPAYCTVFQWVRVVPEFGELYREVRLTLSRVIQEERAAERAAKVRAKAQARTAAGKRPRDWVSGPASRYTEAMAQAFCAAIEDGAAASAVVGRPGMPTAKMVANWLKRFPAFKALYVEACRRREVGLWFERDMVIDRGIDMGFLIDLPRAKAEVAAIEGRIGRLTPKLYRSPPARP